MAATEYGTNHPLAVKIWTKKLMHEAKNKTQIKSFMGTSSDSILHIKTDLNKSAGDTIYVGLRMLLNGDGIQGDATLEGNEEALVTHRDSIVIDQLRNAVRSKGKMSEQRVPFSVREEAMMALSDWYAERLDESAFNQLGGNTGQSDTRRTGNQAASAPTASHIIWPTGLTTEAAVESASASNVFSLTKLDLGVEKSKTLRQVNSLPNLRPIRMNGTNHYVAFLHPYQVRSMRTSTDTGQWLDIQKAAMNGGQTTKNPIFTGALGMYNGVVIHESVYIPTVTSGVYRALFCGAQAACVAFGGGDNKNSMNWKEELFDYGNQLGVGAGMIFGIKKTIYNSNDYGVFSIPTHAAAG